MSTFLAVALLVAGCTRFGFEPTSGVDARPGVSDADGPAVASRWRKELTILRAMLGESCTSALHDFPVLVRIAADPELRTIENGGGVQDPEGKDLVFRTDAGAPLSFDLERYAPTTGELVAWIRVPTLELDTDTTINLEYGDAAAVAAANDPRDVWSAGYVGVWHLSEPATEGEAEHLDSTGSALHGTPRGFIDGGEGSTDVAGVVAGADLFAREETGETNRIEVPNHPSLTPPGDFTVQAWIYLLPPVGPGKVLYKWDDTYFAYQIALVEAAGAARPFFQWMDSGRTIDFAAPATSTVGLNAWTQVVGVRRGTTLEIHVNGALETTVPGASGVTRTSQDPLVLGAAYHEGSGLGGRLDEVRVSNVPRSPCWIETEYKNVVPGASVISVGAAQAI